jgi:hypothetical protein
VLDIFHLSFLVCADCGFFYPWLLLGFYPLEAPAGHEQEGGLKGEARYLILHFPLLGIPLAGVHGYGQVALSTALGALHSPFHLWELGWPFRSEHRWELESPFRCFHIPAISLGLAYAFARN